MTNYSHEFRRQEDRWNAVRTIAATLTTAAVIGIFTVAYSTREDFTATKSSLEEAVAGIRHDIDLLRYDIRKLNGDFSPQ